MLTIVLIATMMTNFHYHVVLPAHPPLATPLVSAGQYGFVNGWVVGSQRQQYDLKRAPYSPLCDGVIG